MLSFSRPIWFLLVGTFLTKGAYFISMPYLALRMQESLHLDPVAIGLVLGIGPLVGIPVGFYGGHLSDQIGRKSISILCLVAWALAFFGFAVATELWHFALLNTLSGITSAIYQPVASALISDLTPLGDRKTVFQMRYFAINLGAVGGPLCGAWLLLSNPSLGFYLTCATYLIFAVLCYRELPRDEKKGQSQDNPRFSETMKTVLGDTPLLFYCLAFVFMGITYSQLESTLPQFLRSVLADDGIKLFGVMTTANALTVVFFQLPLTKATAKVPLMKTIVLGTLVYGIGFSLFGFLPITWPAQVAAMVVLSLGEILIFSNAQLVIDRIAPEDKKGVYFAASGLWAFGPTMGPAIGGFLLMRFGGSFLYIALGLFALLNIFVYRLGMAAESRRPALAA